VVWVRCIEGVLWIWGFELKEACNVDGRLVFSFLC
jgi:hypothetical protein